MFLLDMFLADQVPAAQERAVYLYRVAGRQDCGRPLGAAHHGAVDRDREKARPGVDAAQGEQLGDRRNRHLRFDPVDAQPRHNASATLAACPARASLAEKRSGENGRAISGSIPLSI